jgi:hypothetical protein
MNEPPEPAGPEDPQQPSLLQPRAVPAREEPAPPPDPPSAREQRRPREERPPRPEREQRRARPEQPPGPPAPREPRAVRGQSGGEVSLKTIGIIAFVFGVFLHGCVALSILDDSGLPTESDRPAVVVTSTAVPQATAAPTTLPDRTSCDEIRGTEYRSEAERDFFRRNCITA